MIKWPIILISINSIDDDNPNDDIENIIEAGASTQGYSYEKYGTRDNGIALAFKLVKQ